MNKEKRKYKPEHVLMDAIGFTEHDLGDNREGSISMTQLEFLLLAN